MAILLAVGMGRWIVHIVTRKESIFKDLHRFSV